MTDMLITLHGRKLGLGLNNEVLVLDPATGQNLHLLRSLDVDRVVKLTQAEYDALGTPVATTLYVIVG